ncbi:MAG: hypothetical protein OEM52_06530 [bacterium]|nr:hypothetical protein [bacterium]
MQRIRLLLLFTIAIIMLTGSGCLLLSNRNAESPTDEGGGRTPPLTAAELLSTLETAIVQRNTVLYMQSFDSDSFRFIPDEESATRYGAVFNDFNYTRELRFSQSLFNRVNLPVDSVSEADFTLLSEQPALSGLQVETAYTIRLGLTVAVEQTVTARATLMLVRATDGGYSILSWRDIRTGTAPTISEWKAVL